MKKALITFLAVILFLCNTVGYTEEIVNEATLHLEKPYRYGAEGPNAFDCSGFVFGIDVSCYLGFVHSFGN